jgi:hypothetical protein
MASTRDNRVSVGATANSLQCTLVQALRLCTGYTAHRRSRGIVLLFLDHDTRWGWGVSVMPQPLFTPGKDPVSIVQEVGWAPGPVWTGAENLDPTGIQSLDHPARSKSLYRLSYPAHYSLQWQNILNGIKQRSPGQYFDVVVGLAWSKDPESYASGRIATGRVFHA